MFRPFHGVVLNLSQVAVLDLDLLAGATHWDLSGAATPLGVLFKPAIDFWNCPSQ